MEVFRPRGFDKPMFYLTLALIAAGLIMVTRASGDFAEQNYHQKM